MQNYPLPCLLSLATLLSASLFPPQASCQEQANKNIKIVLIGDSTVASYKNPPQDRPDLTGWGQVLDEFFGPDVTVVNLAISGQSSKSYLVKGHWKKVKPQKPDYVFIQFGHNDCPGKGERYTNPKTDFRDYITRYITESRAMGARPVLVTPVTRRRFQDGRIRTILRPYAEAMIHVGKRQNVPVIDLHAASVEHFNRLGDAGSADYSPKPTDRTHFSRKGALAIARLVVEALPKTEPKLLPHLRLRQENQMKP